MSDRIQIEEADFFKFLYLKEVLNSYQIGMDLARERLETADRNMRIFTSALESKYGISVTEFDLDPNQRAFVRRDDAQQQSAIQGVSKDTEEVV